MDFDNEPVCWTDGAVFCYRRGCRCEGCYVKEIVETGCFMKTSVIRLVRTFGTPPPESDSPYNPTDVKILKAIMKGAENKEQIAKIADISVYTAQARFSKMYKIARKEGFRPKNPRNILPEYISWVKENL